MTETIESLQLVECPRDAMQGFSTIIPTADKIAYFNMLLEVGFHTLDMGSFVSPRAVPQLADTAEVLEGLNTSQTTTQLLVIVANEEGAIKAANQNKVDSIGYPLSLSDTFQLKNTRLSKLDSLSLLKRIKDLCIKNNKSLVVYLSMAFGNPYGENYHPDMVVEMAHQVQQIGVNTISIADTVGLSTPPQVEAITRSVLKEITSIPLGLHLHSEEYNWHDKIEAGYRAGCRRFDSALGGYGGCPFTGSEKVGNMDTEKLVGWFSQNRIPTGIDIPRLKKCAEKARQLFI
jgi:hydroxymethylglutaryl-CoA lyase